MKQIVVDTSVIIDFIRSQDKAATLFFKLTGDYQLCISIVTQAELYGGKSVWESNKSKIELEKILSGLNIITLENDITKESGRLKAMYGINILDSIIAATAIIYDTELATLNIKDFEKIKGINLLGNEYGG